MTYSQNAKCRSPFPLTFTGAGMTADWQDISTVPRGALKDTSETFLLAHAERKWIRFGKWYVQEGCWYYSGTNERSQYAQVRGDDPTHWMPLPSPPLLMKEGGEMAENSFVNV